MIKIQNSDTKQIIILVLGQNDFTLLRKSLHTYQPVNLFSIINNKMELK